MGLVNFGFNKQNKNCELEKDKAEGVIFWSFTSG